MNLLDFGRLQNIFGIFENLPSSVDEFHSCDCGLGGDRLTPPPGHRWRDSRCNHDASRKMCFASLFAKCRSVVSPSTEIAFLVFPYLAQSRKDHSSFFLPSMTRFVWSSEARSVHWEPERGIRSKKAKLFKQDHSLKFRKESHHQLQPVLKQINTWSDGFFA